MTETPFRPEARAPRGFQDRRAPELKAEREVLEAVAKVYEAFGFEPLDTSAFEYAHALGKFLPDADRPNEGVFALQDDDDQWMALRYDLTAPLARFAAENWETLPKPFRRYAFGPVWRNEKPGPGRFRQFTQCDADTVGSARPEADAEIVALAVAGLEAAGLPSGQAVVRINNRKLLDGLLESIGVAAAAQKLKVLRALDKFDRLGAEGVRALLGEGRLDESGAYTEGAKLGPAEAEKALQFTCPIQGDRATVLDSMSRIASSPSYDAAIEGLGRIDAALKALGVGEGQAKFDPTIVRGLEYYTGAVFEADAGELVDGTGRVINFGSIGGGGRYDGLVARFTGEPVPATGFSFGVSRIVAIKQAIGWMAEGALNRYRGPVVVIAFSEADMAHYFSVAGELRAAGIAAEVYLGSSGMKAQMKYADRRNAPAAVMLGGDEIAAGTVTVKDLDAGRQLASGLQDNAAWKAERPGQATIPRAELVPFVKRILGGGQ